MAVNKGVNIARWERSFVRILTPLEEFVHRQTTSGILLMICAVIALIIANTPLYDDYSHLLHTRAGIKIGGLEFSLSIHHWINEGINGGLFLRHGSRTKT